MHIVYVDFILSKQINIKKLGITFRMLNKKEKDFLLYNVNEFLKYKEETIDLVKKYKKYDKNSNAFLVDILDYNDKKRSIVMFGYELLISGFEYNEYKEIEKIINHLLVIECNNEILNTYVDSKSVISFISNLIGASNIYNETLVTDKMRFNSDYTYILTDNLFNKESDRFLIDIMINLIFYYNHEKILNNKYILKQVPLTKKYLEKIECFISELDADGIIKFVEILDLLYSKVSIIQNSIINNVLIVESLLINENSNIQKDYVLKGGMILRKYFKNKSELNNKAIKELLTFVYDIRSDIVHGNMKKIENDLNKINQKNSDVKKLVGKVEDYLTKKNKALGIAYTVSMFVTRSVIRYWIDNPYDVHYLKNN